MENYHVNDDISLEISTYYDKNNVDYNLIVWLSYGGFIKLFLQPGIDEFGEIVAITAADSKDDSFIIHERYYQEIIYGMNELKRDYERRRREV
jgi:hypothetical protein